MIHQLSDHVLANALDGLGHILRAHEVGALLVNHAPLIVRDVVVFQQLLAGIEVVLFHPPLRPLDLARQHAAFDRLARLHAHPGHERLHARRIAENAHQIVFERQIEPAGSRIALAAGTAAQLIVDAPRFVALGADDVQAAGGQHLLVAFAPVVVNLLQLGLVRILDGVDLRLRAAAEHDVRAAARHVGGNGDRAGPAGLGDDVRLALMLLGVEHLVRDLRALQQLRQPFRRFDRRRPHQHRLAALHAILDVLENGLELIVLGEEHQIRLVLADHRLVGRDHHHFQTVDLLEFEGLGVRRARHAGQFRIQPEIILEGDGRDGLVFLANLDALLGLDRLMQAVGPAPPLHGAAGELIDDDHFALAHDVLDIALVQAHARAAPRSSDASGEYWWGRTGSPPPEKT